MRALLSCLRSLCNVGNATPSVFAGCPVPSRCRSLGIGRLALAFALLTTAPLLVAAQEQATPPADAQTPAAVTASPAAPQGPVAVPPASAKAMAYYRSGNVLWVVDQVWGLILPALLLFTGFSARMRDWAQRIGRRRGFAITAYAVLLLVIMTVVTLPLSYYEEFVRQHAYGLSNQTLGKWVGDTVKGLLVSCVILAIVLPGIYFFLRKSPKRWWLYTAAAAIPFMILMQLLGPIWIAPLFNRFGPMKDKQLEAQILALADRAGIEGGRVYEVDKSVDTKAVNAYVAGIGHTKRIVLWDTLLAKLNARQVRFVMAHEMGHYVLGHVPKMIGLVSVLILIALYGAHRTAGAVMARWRSRIGFSELSDVASAPLIMLLAGIFFLAISPIGLAYSRHIEHEADRFGLELTHDNYAAATAFVKLQTENLGNPRPGWLFKLWRLSHPPLGERITFCNEYRPWETGGQERYRSLFREPGTKSARCPRPWRSRWM